MKPARNRRIADALTWARIVSVAPITIAAWYELRWWVLGLYVVAAITDFLDGRFARAASPPTTDLDLDGIADTILALFTLLWLWMLVPGFIEYYGLIYLPLLFAFEIYITSVRLRWPTLPIPHFEYGRFVMTVFFFLLPVVLVFGVWPPFVHMVFILGTAGKIQLVWHLARTDKEGIYVD